MVDFQGINNAEHIKQNTRYAKILVNRHTY